VISRMKAGIMGPGKSAIVRQRLDKRLPVATNAHATIEELLHAVFSIRSMLSPIIN
jgi:hypothetical protein